MTPTTRKRVLIGGGIVLLGITGFIIYRRVSRGKKAALFLEYLDTIPKTNTTAARNEIENAAVDSQRDKGATDIIDAIKRYGVKTVTLDGRVYNLANKDQVKFAVSTASDIAKQLNKAITGLGTDMMLFSRQFKRIGSNSGFILVNTMYKSFYKEGLWEAIEGEEKLYKGAGNGWNAVVGKFVDLPNYAPEISSVVKTWKD